METPPAFPSRHDVEEGRVTDRVIRLAFLGLFAWWSIGLVLPFVGFAIWSVILAVALNPVYLRLAQAFRRAAGPCGGGADHHRPVRSSRVPSRLLATNLVETVASLVEAR